MFGNPGVGFWGKECGVLLCEVGDVDVGSGIEAGAKRGAEVEGGLVGGH